MYTLSRYITEIHYIYLVYFVNCSHGEIFCFIFRFAKHISQSIFLPLILRLHSNSHLLTSLDFGPFRNVIWTWLRIICIFLGIFLSLAFPVWPLKYISYATMCIVHTHTQFLYLFFSSYCVYVHSFVCLSTWNILERNGIQVHGFHDCWIQFAKSLWSYFGNGIRAQLYSIYSHNFIPFVLSMEIIRPKYVR